MSEKRYDTNPEKQLILEGLEFFESSENPDLVNPNEIKTLMDKLELQDKMSFIYDLISELCSNKEIRRNGGLSKNDFISFLEKKLSDSESKEGIHTIYNVFTDSKDDTLPMTNFCRTARDIGDMEKDEELKELLKGAEMTGKELTFEEFHDIMKKDEKNKVQKDEKKYQKHNINRFAKKNIWKKEEKEESEPSEERYSYRSKKNDYINPNKNNEEFEPKNSYSYRRVKVEQTKTVISPKVEEKNEEQPEEKKITVEEIIQEKKVEVPNNNVRYKYKFKNRFRKEPKEEDIKEKENTGENNEENNINNNENSESKRYHRRYRPNNINNDTKNENNNAVTYSRYRRKVEN
jgi:Ca2+-binding EF-hand superfamily protein